MSYSRKIRVLAALAFGLMAHGALAEISPQEAQLRAILDAVPAHDAARERLSVLLLQTGRRDAALYHVRFLAKNAVSPKLRADAAGLVERFEGATWGWRPILSFVPSTNVNKGADGDTIYIGDQAFAIDAESRAQDGVGLTFGAAIWRNWRPNETWRATLSGEASATIYSNDLEDKQRISTTLAFDRRIGDHGLGLGLTLDAQAEEGKLERRRITPFVSGSYALNEDRVLTGRLEFSDVHYPQQTFRNGPTTRLNLGLRQRLSERTRLSFNLPLATERTGRAHLDNDSVGLSARLEQLWMDGKLKTSIGLSHTVDSYLGVFPGASVKRKDQVSTLSLELSKSDVQIRGFIPTIRYEYTDSRSNVSLYDYDSHDVQVTFRRAF